MKIEKGIPVPNRMGCGGRKTTYPFAKMKVGDSISVLYQSENGRVCSLKNLAASYKRGHPGWDYTTRLADDRKTIRLWCISVSKKADP